MTETSLDYNDIAARYTRMRKISFELNKILPKYVPEEAIEATAKKLGIWQDGAVVLGNMDQSCVLFDQAIHGYFRDGKNAVDRYMDQHPPDPGSGHEAVLAAKKLAFYSLFQVEDIVPDVGVHVHDILHGWRHFLGDVGFSQTAVKGMVLATRVLPAEDFIMTTGAALPVDADTLAKVSRLPALNAPSRDLADMSRQEMADVASTIIGLCLKGDGSRSISYQGVDEDTDNEGAAATTIPRVGRNALCPCGSGKKYKKCCINKASLRPGPGRPEGGSGKHSNGARR